MKKLKIATIQDLLRVPTGENGERFISLQDYAPEIKAQYIKSDMLKTLLGSMIVVRRSLADKLRLAQAELNKTCSSYQLLVTYGYRSAKIQQDSYKKKRSELARSYPGVDDLDELTHPFVAFPKVAGHPTGGAIDVTLIDRSTSHEIPLGCHISDFSRPELMSTYSAWIDENEQNNRLLLQDLLVKQGFAPFYGEWWHFSYGDREWAYFYNKPSSLYSPVSVADIVKELPVGQQTTP